MINRICGKACVVIGIGITFTLLVCSSFGASLVFTIDSSQSTISASGTVGGAAISEQGAGSLDTTFGGAVNVDLDDTLNPTSLHVTGLSLDAVAQGSWLPAVGGPGTNAAPADAAGIATGSFDIYFFLFNVALRDLVVSGTAPSPVAVVGNSFTLTNLQFFVTSANLDYSGHVNFSPLSGTKSFAPQSTNNLAIGGSLTYTNNMATLTIPISFTLLQTITYFSANMPVIVNCSGTLVATAPVSGPVNFQPVAFDDSYTTDQETPLNVSAPGVLGNDTDNEGSPLTAAIGTGPTHAAGFTLNLDGSFDYTPTNGFAGLDSFTYHANDATNDSTDATVQISVAASTPTGSVVNVSLDGTSAGANPVSLTFSNVTTAGSTTITPLDPADAGTVPGSYSIFSNLVFEISTTANVTGDVDVCFTLTDTSIDSITFAALRVMHNEGGTLVNRTSSSDFPTRTLCATVSSLSPFAIAVFAPLPDMTVAITNADFTCTNTTKGTICTSAGTLSFANNAAEYGSATFDLTTTEQEKPGKPPKWKVAGALNPTSFSLGANSATLVQLYLSDDATLDGADTPMLKKPVSTAAFEAALAKGKAVKVKLAIPKGVDLSGKHLIIEVDANDPKTGTDVVTESDETNNTAVIGPLP